MLMKTCMTYCETMNHLQVIYSRYIVVGGDRNIGCSHEVRCRIYRALQPPFEDLFDEAEEYSLTVLYVAWTQMINVDMKTYGKVITACDFFLF